MNAMARTYRNKKTVPHGWEVRDDGEIYCRKCNERCEYLSPCTHRPPRFRRGRYCVEDKVHRKEHNRQYRNQVRQALHHEKWDAIPRWRKTSGWLSW